MACNHSDHSRSYCDCAYEIEDLIAANRGCGCNNNCNCGCNAGCNARASGRTGYVSVVPATARLTTTCGCNNGCGCNNNCGCGCGCNRSCCGSCGCCSCNCCGDNDDDNCKYPLQITYPVPGSFVTAPVIINGTAQPGHQVTIRLDGNNLGTVTADASGYWYFTVNTLTTGAHIVTATDPNVGRNCLPNANATFWVEELPQT